MPRYHVDRSIEIDAPRRKVFEAVADFSSWTKWSPWLCAEPAANVTVTEDPSSVGSVYAWDGEIVGAGELEHKQLVPDTRIEDEIRFTRPFRSVSTVSFDFADAASGTRVTWNMDGSLPWFLFWMRGMMSTFIGMDYERGLKMLKEWIETGAVLSSTKILGTESVGPLRVIGVRNQSGVQDIGPAMQAAFCDARNKLGSSLSSDADVITVYHEINFKTQVFDYTSGFVVDDSVNLSPGLNEWSLPVCTALRVEHTGSYEHLGNAWSAANQHARAKKLKQSRAGTYEIYRNDPETTPRADLVTEVYLPLR